VHVIAVRIARNMSLWKKAFLVISGMAAISLATMLRTLNAQSGPRAQFEEASIKRNIVGIRASFGAAPGGRFIATNNPTRNLIVNAYDVRLYQVIALRTG
jgi:hypothetical protein